MIVVHPKDFTTRFLHLIYEGLEGVQFFDSAGQREQLLEALRAAPREEFILLLGHGTPHGLLGGLIGDEDAPLLRDRPNLVGIWCYASTYARRHGLKGFFSGMFISEWYEAEDNGVTASPGEIDDFCWGFAGMFGDLLRAGLPLEAIAADLTVPANMNAAVDTVNDELTRFNLSRLTFRRTGTELLPVREDYWGMDDPGDDKDRELALRGIDALSRDIDQLMWIDGAPVNIDAAVNTAGKECIRLLMERQAQSSGSSRPGAGELAAACRGAGIPCRKQGSGFLEKPTYIVSLPGKDYVIRSTGGKKGAGLGMGEFPSYLVGLVPILVPPDTFLSILRHFHHHVLPLIGPMLEDYCRDVSKRIMIKEIRTVTRENSSS